MIAADKSQLDSDKAALCVHKAQYTHFLAASPESLESRYIAARGSQEAEEEFDIMYCGSTLPGAEGHDDLQQQVMISTCCVSHPPR
ncbi:hypothetical protein VTI28DRAFT_9931 [Corynascus sepedonium]